MNFFSLILRETFYNDIQGDFYLRMAPNTEHSLAPLDDLIINNIATFAEYIKYKQPIPSLTEKITYSNTTATITVHPSQPPDDAKVWQAPTTSNIRRDFRLLTCGSPSCFQPVLWLPSDLTANPDGSYSASVSAPWDGGWMGFVIVLGYKSKYTSDGWFQISSQVVVVPDIYPFPSCGQHCGGNSTTFHNNKINYGWN